MKIFISWSGTRSKAVALELRQWLQDVIHNVEPWMSAIDIQAGTRWSPQIAQSLDESRFGIICLTPENLAAPWILFEAGALAKTVEETFVCPYLFGLSTADLPNGPLSQFQAKVSDKEGTWDLLLAINSAMGNAALSEERLRRAFHQWWSVLETKLSSIPVEDNTANPIRSNRQVADETLEVVRNVERQISQTFQQTSNQFPLSNSLKYTGPRFLYVITVGGIYSDLKHYINQVAQMDGFLSKSVKDPDELSAYDIQFTFTQKIDRQKLSELAEAESLKVLIQPLPSYVSW